VVVNDLNVVGVVAEPTEADSKLVVDADAVLAEPIADQLFESVGRWDLQVGKVGGGIEHNELSQSNALKIRWEAANFLTLKETFRVVVAKTANHGI